MNVFSLQGQITLMGKKRKKRVFALIFQLMI